MEYEQQVNQLHKTIRLKKHCAIACMFCALILTIIVISLPSVLPPILKSWMIGGAGCSLLALLIVLFIVQKNYRVTQYFLFLSTLTSGVFFGISVFALFNGV